MSNEKVEVKVGALIMDPNTNTPIVVLKGVDGEAVLPIWVGAFEANAIALEIEKVAPQRPMTHDLLRNLIIQCGLTASGVVITELVENTFFARIDLLNEHGQTVTIDARPSDAIALALRMDCQIFVAQEVLDVSAASQNDRVADEGSEPNPDDWPELIG